IKKAKAAKAAKAANVFPISPPTFCPFRKNPSGFRNHLAREFEESTMTPRIAVVQHGDVREARRLRLAGEPEPYFGMHYSQGFLDGWMSGRPHLVVSLNAPAYREDQGDGTLVGLPEPLPIRPLPGTANQLRWANRVIREFRAFRPTHLLLRTGSLMSATILRAAVHHHWRTLAMFAGFFPNERLYDRIVTGQI